jgi:2-oxoglutarate ferredoxin oxidoreductase subunit gamma
VKQERKIDARHVELGMYQAVMDQIGKPIVFNICMLGVLIGLTELVKAESITKVLEQKIDPKFMGFNEKALEIGLQLADSRK